MNEQEKRALSMDIALKTNQVNGSGHTAQSLIEAAELIFKYLNK